MMTPLEIKKAIVDFLECNESALYMTGILKFEIDIHQNKVFGEIVQKHKLKPTKISKSS